MDTPVFPQRLYTKGEEPIPGKSIGYYSGNTKLFDALNEALSEDELQEIRDSSLGVCLKFYALDFGWASRLVHYMLTFQLHCKKKFELWSLIGVNPVRFSLHEFDVITGLYCHYVENLETPDVEVTEEMKEFWERLGVGIDLGPSIEDLTKACLLCADWSRDDRLRLGYLAIYAGYIEAKKPSSPTRVNMARLVMNLETFTMYPWGRVAFKNLVQSVKEKDLSRTYSIEGFVEVLQIWVYFSLPDFGAEFGEPIPNALKQNNPVLLHFKGSRGRKYVKEAMLKQNRINNFVIRNEIEEMFPQWDNDEEDVKCDNIIRAMFSIHGPWKWTKSHWPPKGVKVSTQEKPDNSVDLKRICEPEEGSRKRFKAEPSLEDGLFERLKTLIDERFKALTTSMEAGFSACESKISLLAEKVQSAEVNMKAVHENEAKDSEQVKDNVNPAVQNDEAKESEQVKDNPAVQKDEAPPVLGNNPQVVTECVSGGTVSGGTCYEPSVEVLDKPTSGIDFDAVKSKKQLKAKSVAQNVARGKSDRQRKLARSQVSPFQGNSTVKGIIPNKKKFGQGYDPFATVGNEETKKFVDWLKRKVDYQKYVDMENKLPKWPPKNEESLWWYFTLLTTGAWLHDTHLDAAINMFQLRYTNHPEWFRSGRLCFLDSCFNIMWTAKYGDFKNSHPNPDGSGRMLPAGAYDLYSGSDRSNKVLHFDVDDIYTCVNIKGFHWAALCISIPNRHIVVWDSDVTVATLKDLEVILEPISVMLPYMLRELVPKDIQEQFPYDKFTFHREEKGVPQNKESGDCGVYCLKYMECHALGLPFPSTFCDANIPTIRQKFAWDIFNETNIRGDEKTTIKSLDLYD